MDIGEFVKNRREALNMSQEKLGELVGIGRQAVIRLESGNRALKHDEIIPVAQALEVSYMELLYTDKSAIENSSMVPIVATVPGGNWQENTFQVASPSQLETVRFSVPEGIDPKNLVALRVEGNSMDLYAPDGSIIIVDVSQRDPAKLRNRRVIALCDGETTFKRWDHSLNGLVPESSDPSYESIPIRGMVEILGRVIGRLVWDD